MAFGNQFHLENIYHRCIFIDKYNNLDFDFVRLCRKQSKLTFNKKYLDSSFLQTDETPFLEIKTFNNQPNFQPVFDNQKFEYNEIIEDIIEAYKKQLRKIKCDEKYLLCASAGSDTRILCGLLAQLRDEESFNFDNILFHVWGRPEQKEFLEIMKRLKFDNISILDDSIPDAYDIGTDEISLQGWYPYDGQMKFWGKNINPADYILLGGAEGESLVYPWSIWNKQIGYFCNRGESIYTLSNLFKDIFFPLLDKDMMSVTMAIPSHFKGIKDHRLKRDKLRTDLCYRLGLGDIPMPRSYYNFNISDTRKKLMIDLYEKSKFKKDFNIDINFEHVFSSHNTHASRIWGFAVTVYEKIYS